MSNRQLIVDSFKFDISPQAIQEAISLNNGRLIVSGIIQRADSENQNKRIYPKALLEREVSKYLQLIRERRSLGELDHPMDRSVINLANASHLLTDLQWRGNDLIGTIEVLTTPSGNILRELFKCGVSVGISSRGVGSTKEIGEGRQMIDDDFDLLGWDMVSNPSTQGSFVRPLHEGVQESTNKYGKIDSIIRDIFGCLNYDCGTKCEIGI